MPKRRKRDPVVVRAETRENGPLILYGFNTSMLAADGSELGHVALASAPEGIIWFGVNAPKPPRLAKKKATGEVSSFCSADAIVSALDQGWTPSKPAEFSGPSSTDKMQLVGVNMGNDQHYCWYMDKGDFASYGAELGIKAVTKTDEIIIGASYPKPGRVSRKIAGEGDDGTRTQTTFIAPDQDQPEGWSKPRGRRKGWGQNK